MKTLHRYKINETHLYMSKNRCNTYGCDQTYAINIRKLLASVTVSVVSDYLFVSYAHVNLCRLFSSSWCRGLAAASACGCSRTLLLTFLLALSNKLYAIEILPSK